MFRFVFGLTLHKCIGKAKEVLNKKLNDPLKLDVKQTDSCCCNSCFLVYCQLLPDEYIFPEFQAKILTDNLFLLNTGNTIL